MIFKCVFVHTQTVMICDSHMVARCVPHKRAICKDFTCLLHFGCVECYRNGLVLSYPAFVLSHEDINK